MHHGYSQGALQDTLPVVLFVRSKMKSIYTEVWSFNLI
jgi:hypothetical protein